MSSSQEPGISEGTAEPGLFLQDKIYHLQSKNGTNIEIEKKQ